MDGPIIKQSAQLNSVIQQQLVLALNKCVNKITRIQLKILQPTTTNLANQYSAHYYMTPLLFWYWQQNMLHRSPSVKTDFSDVQSSQQSRQWLSGVALWADSPSRPWHADSCSSGMYRPTPPS